LPRITIDLDALNQLLVSAQVEAEHAHTHGAGFTEGRGLAARHPQRRMRVLDGLGDHRPGRDAVELARMRERVLRPHARDHLDGLTPLRLGGLRIDLETVHLDKRGRATGAQVHASIADDVQHGGALGNADRMVVRTRQQGDGVTDPDALGALGDGAVQHLRR
jgi:hypothetical protein